MLIYLVRHGETYYNLQGILQGQSDGKLNENGIQLAVQTGKAMRDIHFDCAYASPLSRAYDTCRYILDNSGNGELKIITDPRLMEINMGDWEKKKYRPGESELDDPERLKLFFSDSFKYPGAPNGETIFDVIKRTKEFLDELTKHDTDETVLVASHGCAIRAMMNGFYDNPHDFWQGHVPYNCSVHILESKNGSTQLLEMDKVYYDKSRCINLFKKF